VFLKRRRKHFKRKKGGCRVKTGCKRVKQ